MRALDGILSVAGVIELDKTVTLGPAGLPVNDHLTHTKQAMTVMSL